MTEEEEMVGLDRTEMGMEGYASDVMGGRYVDPDLSPLLPDMHAVRRSAGSKAST